MNLRCYFLCYRHRCYLCVGLILFFWIRFCFASIPSLPSSIEIFTTPESSISIPDPLQSRTTLYDLSAPDHLFNAVNATLPIDPAAAQLQAKTLISSTNFNADVRLAYQGIARAASYGLTRYPAIVFDGGCAVIYGQTDLNSAVHTYQQWQEAQHAPK